MKFIQLSSIFQKNIYNSKEVRAPSTKRKEGRGKGGGGKGREDFHIKKKFLQIVNSSYDWKIRITDAQEGGDICIPMANPCWCTAGINTTL